MTANTSGGFDVQFLIAVLRRHVPNEFQISQLIELLQCYSSNEELGILLIQQDFEPKLLQFRHRLGRFIIQPNLDLCLSVMHEFDFIGSCSLLVENSL